MKQGYVRVVMMTAFPTATLRKVCHMSRFIFGSIPVENSSMRTTAGLPKYRIKEMLVSFNLT